MVHRKDIKKIKKDPYIEWKQPKCPRQPQYSKVCGYYVCRYTLEIIKKSVLWVSDKDNIVINMLELFSTATCSSYKHLQPTLNNPFFGSVFYPPPPSINPKLPARIIYFLASTLHRSPPFPSCFQPFFLGQKFTICPYKEACDSGPCTYSTENIDEIRDLWAKYVLELEQEDVNEGNEDGIDIE
uniref:Uncharacterized protein n=1 Tax=Chenopodium quinoa TaxID=63459 RepID=A0A803N8A0_CHEQI